MNEFFDKMRIAISQYGAYGKLGESELIEDFRNKLAEYDSLEDLKKDIEIIYMQSL